MDTEEASSSGVRGVASGVREGWTGSWVSMYWKALNRV